MKRVEPSKTPINKGKIVFLFIALFFFCTGVGISHVVHTYTSEEVPQIPITANIEGKEIVTESFKATSKDLKKLKENIDLSTQKGVPLKDRKVSVNARSVQAWMETTYIKGKETREYTFIGEYSHKTTIDKYMPLPDKTYEDGKYWYYEWMNLKENHLVIIIKKHNKRVSKYKILKE